MAMMIPAQTSPEIKSNAEKKIFSWFQNAPGTEDWVVLHSLGISNHNHLAFGEVDFFVLAPGLGYFALEVKGGRVKRNGGTWYFTNRYDKTDSNNRGPFDQARDAVYSLRRYINESLDHEHGYLTRTVYGIGVMFPDIEYASVGCDQEQWQVFDCHDGKNVKRFVERIADGAARNVKKQLRNLDDSVYPTREDVRYLAGLLRGDFDVYASLATQFNYAEEKMISLTKNQYHCIDQLEDNPRCFIYGAAGTGKTLLAVEEAKKAAANGERVALFCYNSLLGSWLKEYFTQLSKDLRPSYVGTIHGYMFQLLKEAGMNSYMSCNTNNSSEFFDYELPALALSAAQKGDCRFDRIIVDETQDLMTETFLAFFDTCLSRGLSRGKWTFFGDYSNQAIYSKSMSAEDYISKLEDYGGFIRFKLITNCRNTKNICEETMSVSGITYDVSGSEMVVGPQVEYITYNSQEDQRRKLVDLITKLQKNSVELSRITILSPRKRAESVVSLLNEIEVKDYSIPTSDWITFSTIHSFKGLENTVIILADIETFSDYKLMYVAFSRAKSGLYVLETQEANDEYIKLFTRRYESNG